MSPLKRPRYKYKIGQAPKKKPKKRKRKSAKPLHLQRKVRKPNPPQFPTIGESIHRKSKRYMALDLQFLKNEEGLRLEPYCDKCGKTSQTPHAHGGYITIGYGHKFEPGEKIPKSILKSTADAMFILDVKKKLNDIKKYHTTLRLNDNQLTAVLSFVFNLGAGVLQHHKTFGKELNARHFGLAAKAMLLYHHAHDKGLPCNSQCDALLKRRERERALFLKPQEPAKTIDEAIAEIDREQTKA